ncbi:MAG: fatty acid desaturase [Amaricoccus sp.]
MSGTISSRGFPGIEIPTLALIAATTLAWGAVTHFAAAIGQIPAALLLALLLALHSSLQHEVIHGHPFRNQRLNDALVFPAFGLFVPYERFRALHLAHHHDPLLTDPYDDPESNYLDPAVWAGLPCAVRLVLAANNTLIGRMLIGPVLGTAWLWHKDAALIRRGDRTVARAYLLHLLALAPVLAWLVALGTISAPAYLLACWLALSVLRIRTFLEHRAHERHGARSVIIEDRGPLALLFLNNNFHAVHHAHPRLPWYRLPAEYARRRDEFLRRNDGYRYRSYAEVFRLHLLRRKDPVAHPIWSRPR